MNAYDYMKLFMNMQNRCMNAFINYDVQRSFACSIVELQVALLVVYESINAFLSE